MKKTYYRGDVYMADLGQGIGSEQGGSRPVVIVQNDTGNHFSPTVIVAAMTSKGDSKAKLPTHFTLESFTQLPSMVLCEQVRTLDKQRLGEHLGRVYPQPELLQVVEEDALPELGEGPVPGVLVRLLYRDNPQDEAWLTRNTGAVALALARGLAEVLGAPFQHA